VYAELDPSPDNPGGFIVTVAIADVSWYVRPNSPLDLEALKRGNSVMVLGIGRVDGDQRHVAPIIAMRHAGGPCGVRLGDDRRRED
ncbi:RNB domain-containing ribonuclease, partial [Rhizobium leguminosarum]|uniref:RNB domain-containing ribonuclease n=1 Tax=Rhizobium leguminosarum TaxID=384 RepID=UPI003F9A5367